MKQYICTVCGYIHETEGELPDDFKCPLCGAGTKVMMIGARNGFIRLKNDFIYASKQKEMPKAFDSKHPFFAIRFSCSPVLQYQVCSSGTYVPWTSMRTQACHWRYTVRQSPYRCIPRP